MFPCLILTEEISCHWFGGVWRKKNENEYTFAIVMLKMKIFVAQSFKMKKKIPPT